MGQYYKPVTKEDETITIYNRDLIVNGKSEYTLAKLMEHSWWKNNFVNSFCKEIYKKRKQVIWLGDYSDEFMDNYPNGFNGLSALDVEELSKLAWYFTEEDKSIAIPSVKFSLRNKFIVNHTKRLYLNCNEYYNSNKVKDRNRDFFWCIHPLPLLTCIGNGCGGGDYRWPTNDSDIDDVGSWAWDEISIEDKAPDEYYKTMFVFKEEN